MPQQGEVFYFVLVGISYLSSEEEDTFKVILWYSTIYFLNQCWVHVLPTRSYGTHIDVFFVEILSMFVLNMCLKILNVQYLT